MLAEGFLDRVLQKANRLKQQLAMLRDRHPGVIEEIHGEGLMIGIKCRITNTDLVAALIDEKMLSVGAGDNQVRLLPPLNIEDAQISAAIVALDAACAKLSAKL